jgi:hypothetical protein
LEQVRHAGGLDLGLSDRRGGQQEKKKRLVHAARIIPDQRSFGRRRLVQFAWRPLANARGSVPGACHWVGSWRGRAVLRGLKARQ